MEQLIEYLRVNTKDINILYVEDNRDVREITSIMLQKLFCSVIEAVDGVDGLEKYKKNKEKIDLVITDINMPNMNGIKMIEKIKSINAHQNFLVISAHGESKYLTQAIQLGVDGYLLKPTVTEQFLETLVVSVEKIQLKREKREYQIALEKKNIELEVLNNSLEISVQQRTQEIEDKLYRDDLTGLSSRFKLKADIENVAFPIVILVDIDDFHIINEFFGTNAGDEVLKDFANFLREYAKKKNYKLYRISGDQFVLFESVEFIDYERIEQELSELFELVSNRRFTLREDDTESIELSITAGVVVEKENILGKADMALCYAKDNHSKFSTYHLSIDFSKEIENSVKWLALIKKGLKYDLFIPCFQPIVNREQKVVKSEVLMRLISEEDKLDINTSPWLFLPIAIKTKHYSAMSRVIIEKALVYLKESDTNLSINLSYKDIKNKKLLRFLKKALGDSRVAKRIIFEITESEEIDDFEMVVDFIKIFKDMGVRIAIDDFGTGYSNFTHIMRLKPDYLKIDGSLIKNIHRDKDSFELVKAIVQFSKELNIKTIAEYVYSREVFETAFSLGVDEFQGYYFAKPSRNLPIMFEEVVCNS